MNTRADILVYDHDQKLQLVVEVKSKHGASADWAAQMRRNLLVHSMIPNAPYFLLALPDFFYLWKDSENDAGAPPDYTIDTSEALASYADRPGLSLGDISHNGLERLVSSWLHDLINADLRRERAAPALHGLFDSGLYDSIKNGSVAV